MSKSFFNNFINYARLAFSLKLSPFYIYSANVLLTYGHGCFTFATTEQEDLFITKKYKFVKNGFTNFMVVDSKGRHFNVNNSFWYWKWDSIEDWTNIKPLEKRRVCYYGYRIPFLGMFPNIIYTNEVGHDNDTNNISKENRQIISKVKYMVFK